MKSCSFTGHRSILPEHGNALRELLIRAVTYAYNEGARSFFSGGAVGFDTLAAETVLELKKTYSDIRLCLVLPCRSQDEKWSGEAKANYARLLRAADSIEYVSESYTYDCMKKRNQRLVDACDCLIAYAYRVYSGAYQTIRMANREGKTVYNLYPTLAKNE